MGQLTWYAFSLIILCELYYSSLGTPDTLAVAVKIAMSSNIFIQIFILRKGKVKNTMSIKFT